MRSAGQKYLIMAKKQRNAKRRPAKPIGNKDVMNIYHPDIFNQIEFAFEVGKTKYYCFKQDSEGRYGRYIVLQTFLQEYHLRTSLQELKGAWKKIENWLNPTAENGRLEIGKVLELVYIQQQRCEIAFEPQTVYNLASCLYFDDTEILSGYDRSHNEKKIALWKEGEVTDFFFHKLFRELTRLTVTSQEDLTAYLRQVPELLKGYSIMEDSLSQ